jgi:hypothetical protein
LIAEYFSGLGRLGGRAHPLAQLLDLLVSGLLGGLSRAQPSTGSFLHDGPTLKDLHQNRQQFS